MPCSVAIPWKSALFSEGKQRRSEFGGDGRWGAGRDWEEWREKGNCLWDVTYVRRIKKEKKTRVR